MFLFLCEENLSDTSLTIYNHNIDKLIGIDPEPSNQSGGCCDQPDCKLSGWDLTAE